MIVLFLIVSLFASFSNANVPVCNEVNAITFPGDESIETWYPHKFTPTLIPSFPAHYKCKYEIKVPKGYSARVILFSKNSGKHSPVYVIDPFGNSEKISTASGEHFYFNEQGGLIKLSTESHEVHFGFEIDWKKTISIKNLNTMDYVSAFFKKKTIEPLNKYKVQVGQMNPEMLKIMKTDSFVVKAQTRVSMTVISGSRLFDRNLLRSVFVYDGPNLDAPCIGSAFQLWKMKSQYVSTGKYMTLQFLSRDMESSHPMIFFQDYENTKHINQFQGFTCTSGHNCGVFELDASKGPVALQSIYDGHYSEKDIITSLEGHVRVHIGMAKKNEMNIVKFFNGTDNRDDLPQMIQSPFKTYVVMSGTAKINISRVWEEFGKTKNFERNGFITSNFYAFIENKQHAFEEIFAPIEAKGARFVFRILHAALDSDDAYLKITGRRNEEVIYQKTPKSSISDNAKDLINYPEREENQFYGDKMTVFYDGGKSKSKGFYLIYAVETDFTESL